MREVLINILPFDIASGNIAIERKRLNSIGEIVTSRIPYISHFPKCASGERIGRNLGRPYRICWRKKGALAVEQSLQVFGSRLRYG